MSVYEMLMYIQVHAINRIIYTELCIIYGVCLVSYTVHVHILCMGKTACVSARATKVHNNMLFLQPSESSQPSEQQHQQRAD